MTASGVRWVPGELERTGSPILTLYAKLERLKVLSAAGPGDQSPKAPTSSSTRSAGFAAGAIEAIWTSGSRSGSFSTTWR